MREKKGRGVQIFAKQRRVRCRRANKFDLAALNESLARMTASWADAGREFSNS